MGFRKDLVVEVILLSIGVNWIQNCQTTDSCVSTEDIILIYIYFLETNDNLRDLLLFLN